VSILDAMRQASAELEQQERDLKYKTDIALWAKDKLGFTLWSKQVEIAKALLKYRRVAVKSGHGVGKSFVASIIIAWWVDTHKDVDSVAVTSAPTQPQLDIIWGYLRDHHRQADLLGRITLDNEWKSDIDSQRAYGRKPANTNIHAFQGVHRRQGVLAVLDESCGIPESIFTAVDAITTGRYDACLAIGNPDDINTPFGNIWKNNDESWHKITINSYDSPNISGEEFPEDASGGLVTPEWIEARIRAWGEDSPRFKSKVLGEFTMEGTNALFSEGTLTTGRMTDIPEAQDCRPNLGVDVARMGEDYSVLYANYNGRLRLIDKWAKADATETTARIIKWAFELNAKEVRIDGVGLGGPIVDFVAKGSENRFTTIGIVGNAASPDLDKWINARAYYYDTMREDMRNGRIDLDDADKDLSTELSELEYHFKNARNALQIMSKEEIRLKTGKSPDFADAALYASLDPGIDVTDPVNAARPGDTIEIAAQEFLADLEARISPF
jgi:hypothetical protein